MRLWWGLVLLLVGWQWADAARGGSKGNSGGQWARLLHWWKDISQIRARARKILAYHLFELLQRRQIYVQFPLQILAHSLHNDRPRLVGVSIVAYDLSGQHECRHKESMAQ